LGIRSVGDPLQQAREFEAIGLAADVTQVVELERLRAGVDARFGPPDILACFAGGLGEPVRVLEMDEATWRTTLDVDLTAKFLTVRAFAPPMRDRAGGTIILMSSASGRLVSGASAAYGAAQAGTLMLMRHLAQELGPAGVRVNAISFLETESIETAMCRSSQLASF
jgi:3-oxoacyl-[acyl-carrier protein] reductase